MLTGKKIVLGVSGGIAAYKMANVASMLSKLHADIHVVMTENATHFITPETFEVLTGNHCYTDGTACTAYRARYAGGCNLDRTCKCGCRWQDREWNCG